MRLVFNRTHLFVMMGLLSDVLSIRVRPRAPTAMHKVSGSGVPGVGKRVNGNLRGSANLERGAIYSAVWIPGSPLLIWVAGVVVGSLVLFVHPKPCH